VIDDTMFFPKLRRHAKWVFVFLALVFGLGFVGFGVGAGGVGVGDILRDAGGSSGGVSVSDARKRTEKDPKDAQAFRDLATALQTEGQIDEAIVALDAYLALRPKDASALRELAGLHLAVAREQQQTSQVAQARGAYLGVGAVSGPQLDLGGGQTLGADPISSAVSSVTSRQSTEALTKAQAAYKAALDAYARLQTVSPDDPSVLLELAPVAIDAGELGKAIAAYERYLKLAPDDSNAPLVRQQLKQLRAYQASLGG
jgi:tetratricopeptide (TPR) repeat protein